jgi:hypothetical protein
MVTLVNSDDGYDDDDDDADDIVDVPSVQDARRIVGSNPIKKMERRKKNSAHDAVEMLAFFFGIIISCAAF